jgi:hypothetical protein
MAHDDKSKHKRKNRTHHAPRFLHATPTLANADASSIDILSDQQESKDLSYPSRRQRSQLLIANLELEFHLTGCRTNDMQISNRKFRRFSRTIPQSLPLIACSSTQVVLIYGGAIKTPRKTLKRCGITIFNRQSRGALKVSRSPFSGLLLFRARKISKDE